MIVLDIVLIVVLVIAKNQYVTAQEYNTIIVYPLSALKDTILLVHPVHKVIHKKVPFVNRGKVHTSNVMLLYVQKHTMY